MKLSPRRRQLLAVVGLGLVPALAAAAGPPIGFLRAGTAESSAVVLDGLRRGTGDYDAKILKGAKPAELPMERPTTFELVIKLQTARRIGITIPRALQVQAERVVE